MKKMTEVDVLAVAKEVGLDTVKYPINEAMMGTYLLLPKAVLETILGNQVEQLAVASKRNGGGGSTPSNIFGTLVTELENDVIKKACEVAGCSTYSPLKSVIDYFLITGSMDAVKSLVNNGKTTDQFSLKNDACYNETRKYTSGKSLGETKVVKIANVTKSNSRKLMTIVCNAIDEALLEGMVYVAPKERAEKTNYEVVVEEVVETPKTTETVDAK